VKSRKNWSARRHLKSNTECWRLNTGTSRRGIALIITLTIMALLLILATAFVVNMRTERTVAFNYRRRVEARQAALAGLDTGIAKMARFYTDAEFVKGTVATMAGRFYYTNGVGATVTIPGVTTPASRWAYGFTNMLMFSWLLPGPQGVFSAGFTNWADKVNMNGGNFWWPQNVGQSGSYLPIANPSVNSYRAGAAGTSWGPDKAAIWAAYIPSNGNRGSYAKFAFWIDDESSKINISNAAAPDLSAAPFSVDNRTTNFWAVGTPAYPCGMIVQPDPIKHITKQLSTVDLSMLDVGKACPAYPYPVANGPWTDAATLSGIEALRNGSTWLPFQTPEEVLSLNNNLTMNDYQAVKSCLTAWSAEKTDFSHFFRTSAGAMIPRVNVGNPLNNQADGIGLYNFLTGSTSTNANLPLSTFMANSFGSSKPTYQNKYTDTQQPFLKGGPGQIAANIVSYLTDPTQGGVLASIPIGSGQNGTAGIASSPYEAKYTASPTAVPTGPCGLWKAAYMNEIAVSFVWQPLDANVDMSTKPPTLTRWQLWASVCVELINPYEIILPISNMSYREEYHILFDNSASQFKVTAACSPSPPPGPVLSSPPASLTFSGPVSPNNYSFVAVQTYTNLCQAWPVTPPTLPTNTPPAITTLNVTLPQQIRQTMWNGASGTTPADRYSIIDWYSVKTQGSVPSGYSGTPLTPTSLAPPKMTWSAAQPLPNAADAAFWIGNPTRVSIAKNDPRVHAWYDTKGAVTLGQAAPNCRNAVYNSANFSYDGDTEPTAPAANPPETRSNFAIANRGMRSVGELGFIHTGKPWRSLSMQYFGAQHDETGAIGSSNKAIPDWAIMDLFSVNSPPIYGRVNINTGGWHLGNHQTGAYQGSYPQCPTFEERKYFPVHPNLLADWPDASYQLRFNNLAFNSGNAFWNYFTIRMSAYNGYRYNTVTQPTLDVASVPLAAALGVIPNSLYRNRLANYISCYYHATNPGRTTFAPQGDFSDASFNANRGDIYNPYYTVSQICELPNMNYLFSGDGTQTATTDADKEDTIRRIIGVLTTRGDVFTVHANGYSDSGEARVMAVVERIYDPLATQLSDRNKFRILQMRWISD